MLGLEVGFKCGYCKEEQVQAVTGTKLYEINNKKDVEYIPLNCSYCSRLNYIAIDVMVVDSLSEEHINEAYDQRAKELSNKHQPFDEVRSYLEGKIKFITEDEHVILPGDIKEIEGIGASMF